jgi:RNA polymerase-interacting CarD/CdnL/TRCF family regulator
MATKGTLVKIKDIEINFFVRIALNADHVEYFRSLYDSEEAVEPILLEKLENGKFGLIEGRHRIEGSKKAGYTSIRAEFGKFKDQKDRILNAVLANIGGALPPTMADYEYSIELLMNEKMTKKEVMENFPLPPQLTSKLWKRVQDAIYRRTKRAAVEAIIRGDITLKQAAEKFRVSEADLKFALKNKAKQDTDIDTILKALENSTRSLSQNWAQKAKMCIEKYQQGDFHKNDLARLSKRIKESSKKVFNTAEEVIKRLDTAITPKAVETKEQFKQKNGISHAATAN